MRFAVQDPGVAHVFSEAMDEHAALQRESPARRREARADWDPTGGRVASGTGVCDSERDPDPEILSHCGY